jgi:hypothetical protein
MSKDKIKSFSSGHIFNLIEFKGKLPRIPILVNEYKSIIKKEVFSLDYGKGIANTERENNKIKNSIFNNINHHKFYKKKNNVFKRKNFAKSATPKKIYSRNLQYKKRIKLPSDILNNNISNSKSEIFLTDIPNNNNSNNYEYINNRINNFKTIDLSNISLGKKKLPPIRNREFIKSLDFLILNADLNYEYLQDQFDDVNQYEKKMIKKCDKYFKKLDDKITIKSDEFIKEKFVEHNKIRSMKFHDYFDKIISQKKEFDYIAMMNILKNNEKKKKLKEIVNRQKSNKKHEKFYKIIEDSKIEIEKANRLIDSMIKN